MRGKRMDNVALGNDSIDPLAVVAGDEGPDIAGDQRVDRRANRVARPDRRHRTSLVLQDCFDIHRVSLASFCARRPNAYRTGAAAVLAQYMAVRRTLGDEF